MTHRSEYKEALGRLDKDTRVCFKYLERLINDKFNVVLSAQQPPPRVNLSKIESTLDSLQKQVDGLRPKVESAYGFTKEYDNAEIFLKGLIKKADEVLGEVKSLFDELYASGFFKKEGTRRKIREVGLFDPQKWRESE